MQRFPGMLVAAGALSVGGNPGVHAQSSEIVTTGFATISSTPTGATVALSLATLAPSAASAATRNAEKVWAVMAAIGERIGRNPGESRRRAPRVTGETDPDPRRPAGCPVWSA